MGNDNRDKHWPTELRLSPDRRSLRVGFENGASFELAAEYLRVFSPSAEVQGHSPAERKLVSGKRNVAIRAIEPVGNYAVRLVFEDGHSTGIYGWSYLYELGSKKAEKWAEYLAELEAKGADRDTASLKR
jgi:DUF971 family protein